VLGGEGEVVHHRELADVDGLVDDEFAAGIRAMVGHVGWGETAVAEEVQFAGDRADLRMRRHRVLQPAVEVVWSDGV
jgi:hypothetical protein